MRLINIYIICITTLPQAIRSDDFIYTRNHSSPSQIPSHLTPIAVQSRQQCATICSIDLACRGFFYVEMSKECFPELPTSSTASISSDNDDVPLHEGQYYLKSPPPVESTSQSPTMACPSVSREVALEDTRGKTYLFTLLKVDVNQSEAVALCDACGLRMLTLNDDAKIDTLTNFLRDTGYNAISYWTDATKHTVPNGTEWRNSDGAVLGSSIWCDTAIDENEHCARLCHTCDFKLRDIECWHQGFSVICE